MEQKNDNTNTTDQQWQCHLLLGYHRLSMEDAVQGFSPLAKCLLPLWQMVSAGKMVPGPSCLTSTKSGSLWQRRSKDEKDMRKKGADFFYKQQAKFKRIFDLLDASKKRIN